MGELVVSPYRAALFFSCSLAEFSACLRFIHDLCADTHARFAFVKQHGLQLCTHCVTSPFRCVLCFLLSRKSTLVSFTVADCFTARAFGVTDVHWYARGCQYAPT